MKLFHIRVPAHNRHSVNIRRKSPQIMSCKQPPSVMKGEFYCPQKQMPTCMLLNSFMLLSQKPICILYLENKNMFLNIDALTKMTFLGSFTRLSVLFNKYILTLSSNEIIWDKKVYFPNTWRLFFSFLIIKKVKEQSSAQRNSVVWRIQAWEVTFIESVGAKPGAMFTVLWAGRDSASQGHLPLH